MVAEHQRKTIFEKINENQVTLEIFEEVGVVDGGCGGDGGDSGSGENNGI